MSSWPGGKLEDLVWDTFGRFHGRLPESWPMKLIDREKFKALVAFYEPYRDELEMRSGWYDEDESGSWRDFRSMVLWDKIPDPPKEILEMADVELIHHE